MPELKLATFPHPVLRQKSKPIARVDKSLGEIVEKMFEIMYAHQGVGLAANQVELPIRLFVCNPTGVKGEGPEMVFLNPVISQPRGVEEQEEGCLSLPGIRAKVNRNKTIWVNAYDMQGNEIKDNFSGFLARVIQHETDHLDGLMFIDRLSPERARTLETGIENLVEDYRSRQRTGSLISDEAIMAQAAEWERKFC